jgi:hypothetical protein
VLAVPIRFRVIRAGSTAKLGRASPRALRAMAVSRAPAWQASATRRAAALESWAQAAATTRFVLHRNADRYCTHAAFRPIQIPGKTANRARFARVPQERT